MNSSNPYKYISNVILHYTRHAYSDFPLDAKVKLFVQPYLYSDMLLEKFKDKILTLVSHRFKGQGPYDGWNHHLSRLARHDSY